MLRLINCFEVPDGRDDEFLDLFRAVNAHMSAQDGYVGHRLHRALTADARYRFVNYVEWKSTAHLRAARDDRYRELASAVIEAGFTSTHSVYEVVHEGKQAGAGPCGGAGSMAEMAVGPLAETSDMIGLHRVFRDALAAAPQ
ncbi:MAG: antibiotic biosynthesis monooxygenase family protein, partial [Sciscionella sp.]